MGLYESWTQTFTGVQCKPKPFTRKFSATKNNHQALANIFKDHAFLGISSSLPGDKGLNKVKAGTALMPCDVSEERHTNSSFFVAFS